MSDLRKAAEAVMEQLKGTWVSESDPVAQDLKAALAEPVLAPAPGYCKHCKQYTIEEPLPAEPVQEPVAKVELMTTGGNVGLATRIVEIDDHLRERLRPGQLLYTAQPQRKPLTEEEIYLGTNQIDRGERGWAIKFARAIERAHGIGNE